MVVAELIRRSIVAACSLLAATGHAQINYLSATRSVSGDAYVSPSSYNQPPDYVISYSGDFAGSNSPAAPFVDFDSNCTGTATLVYNWTEPYGNGPWTVTASVYASQSSFLHPQELSFGGGAATWGTPSSYPGSMPSGAWGQGNSSLVVTFSVSAPVSYWLMCEGTGDPLAVSDTYNLSSAQQGVLVSGSSGSMYSSSEYGVPIYYSGTFNPGDVYTLSASSAGSLDGGGLQVDLLVPEPSSLALLAVATPLLLTLHRSRGGRSG